MSDAPQARTLALDHVVIAVQALAPAGAFFTQCGLMAAGGGRHSGVPTANALFALAGGAYGELLALQDPLQREAIRARHADGSLDAWLASQPALARRFLPAFTHGEGVADLVLRSADLAATLTRLRAAGVAVEGPIGMGRVRDDGVALAWRLALPATRVLPFLIEDETPLELRVPALAPGSLAARIAHVIIACHDVAHAAGLWQVLLDAPAPATHLVLGATAIELRQVPRDEREGACRVVLTAEGVAPQHAEVLTPYGISFAS